MNDATYKELTDYSDRELAFFVKNRLPYFDPKVHGELQDYVSRERKLTYDDISRLTAEKVSAGDSRRCAVPNAVLPGSSWILAENPASFAGIAPPGRS